MLDRRQRKIVLWLTGPVVVAFVAAIIFANIFAVGTARAVSTPGGNGEACSDDPGITFYNMQNSIHPGEIGGQSFLGCNSPARISGSQCLEQYTTFGWQVVNASCWIKGTAYGAVGYGMTTWDACSFQASQPVYEYRVVSTWNIVFNRDGYSPPNLQDRSAAFFTRCGGPQLVQAY